MSLGVRGLGPEVAATHRALGALPDQRLAADVPERGLDGLELKALETVPVDAVPSHADLVPELATLAELWRERLAGV